MKKTNESMTVEEAIEQIRDSYTGDPNHQPDPEDVITFIQENWTKLTGLSVREMHAEQEFPDEVLYIIDEFDIEYDHLCMIW